MGQVQVNLTNFIAIGLMAYTAVWVINKGITMAGYPQFKA